MRGELPVEPCPACASLSRSAGDLAHLLADGLRNEGNLSAYSEHRGICLEHLFALADIATPELMTVIAQRLLRSLSELDAAAMLTLLAGTDRDGPRRARWRTGLPDIGRCDSTIEELCEELHVDACPICLAGGVGERRYLEWHEQASYTSDTSLRSSPGDLCSAHLHDLALCDDAAARSALDRKRVAAMRALELLLAEMRAIPRATKRRHGTGRAVSREVQRVLRPLHRCPACRARSTAELRQAELLDAAIALPEIRAAYESSHGLCVRHAMRLSAGTAAQIAHRVVDARLAVLQWELDEICRKYAWDCRHERAGPEQDAWLRGLAQIDGRILVGSPAVTRPAGELGRAHPK